jgi:glycosyltransferase involved in cell wall biosynthesis
LKTEITSRQVVAELRIAMRERLNVAAPYLGVRLDYRMTDAEALNELCADLYRSMDSSRSWLLFIAITGTFPTSSHLLEFERLISLSTEATAMVGALEGALDAASRPGVGARKLRIVENQTVVDVAFCASYEHNTGIQRVVRQTMPHWRGDGTPHTLITWTHDSSAMRVLNAIEQDRVLHWNDRRLVPKTGLVTHDEPGAEIVVPWNSHVFLPEVPAPQQCLHLACLAEFSGNRVTAIGYDAIPVVSAESQVDAESDRFAHYLTVLKHSDRVLAISKSAGAEFRGFSNMLETQGLGGPEVVSVSLASEAPATRRVAAATEPGPLPLIVCVGSHEPRKNQEAVLHAATLLYNEGLKFELVFVGAGSAAALLHFDDRLNALRKRGAEVSSYRRLPDAELWGLFARARFSVFVSTHEGFGLPVAESLAFGVPVLASNYGSVAEVASEGGCVTVDPRDDDAIVAGMRKMITDDALIEGLRQEARAIRQRTWAEYADELWAAGRFGELAS